MADAKISALPEAASIGDSDELVVNDSGTTKKVQAVNAIPTGAAGAGLTGGGGSALAVNPDDSTIETSGDALQLKDNGVTLAKMNDQALTHAIGYNTAVLTNGATVGSDVIVKTVVVSDALMSVGTRITINGFFQCSSGTGVGTIALYDEEDALLKAVASPTLTVDATETALIELDIYALDGDEIYVLWKIRTMDTSGDVQSSEINGLNTYTFTSTLSDEWNFRYIVNGSDASSIELHFAVSAFYPFMNDN